MQDIYRQLIVKPAIFSVKSSCRQTKQGVMAQ